MELLFPLLILALLVPMFLGIRRQKKEMAKTAELQDSLNVGDRVLTTSGLHATVVELGEGTVDLEVAPGIVTTWSRMVIRELLVEDDEEFEEEDIDEILDETPADETPAVEKAPVEETPEETKRRLDTE
ncbi:preprotein translocase subunit YajC [Rhodococcus sp. PvR044]|jgi:preprotein translocase subunit YajC|uniref:preprotein translocase subunit YajC n=1 Tax=unclassified Rhodococcus (in: high G+C Gram-positive bacteria) TaxID=192944 RepID=UPI000BCF3A59|nr:MULTISPECIES: preprotein translocase subunit YajC [unclassified Rhodococcus (in: high G+C Gram-positive bacteria)]MBP1158513.1 preprotein translocase subunit YajC [Rhodococcus sp. PvR099]PTR45634.1 preprotein translocase subunit YajC [Rhodococcus sp. OK611]SNX89184.1 preprotein translocase subunit YajC [Rhodococcus sp. OK270]